MSNERSMNCADLAAARRLIAQFEDRADGRHNSTNMPGARPTELRTQTEERPNDLPCTYAAQPVFGNGLPENGGEIVAFQSDQSSDSLRVALEELADQVYQRRNRRPPAHHRVLGEIHNSEENRGMKVREELLHCEISDVVIICGDMPRPSQHWRHLRVPIPRRHPVRWSNDGIAFNHMLENDIMEFNVIRCYQMQSDGTPFEFNCWRRIK